MSSPRRFFRILFCLGILSLAGWNAHAVTIAQGNPGGDEGAYACPAMVEGRPAVAWLGNNHSAVKYVRAADAAGITWGPTVIVEAGVSAGLPVSLQVVAGNPAICYYDIVLQKLKYARALDATGSAWAPPIPVNIANFPAVNLTMQVVDGNPAIAFTGDGLRFTRALDSTGSAWGTAVVVDSAAGFADPSLKIVEGRPAIAYSSAGGIWYRRAQNAAGTAWGGRITAATSGGSFSSMQIVDGRPAISFYHQSNADLMHVKAADAEGNTWSTPVIVDGGGVVGQFSSLAVVNEKAVVGYYAGTPRGDLRFIEATSAAATAWNAPVTVSSSDDAGQYASIFDVNGRPALIYHNVTRGSLQYVRAADEAAGSPARWPPEVLVEQPSNSMVPDGGARSFGVVVVGSTKTLSFTLKNPNPTSTDLTIQSLTIDGPDAAEFSLTGTPPVTPVAALGSTQFRVRYDPVSPGRKTAVVHLASNGDSPLFNITLTGDSTPDVVVEQPPGSALAEGATLFFPLTAAGGTADMVFNLRNTGGADLNGLVLSIDGTNAGEYFLTAAPAITVVPGGSTSFTVRHAPLTAGEKSVQFHLASNVTGSRNPFDFHVWMVPGMPDQTFNSAMAGTGFLSLALQTDGKILACGPDFLTSLKPNGALDTAFFAPPVSGGRVNCVVMQKDGRILLGGGFDHAGGSRRQSLARVFPDGSLDVSFLDPAVVGEVNCLAVQADGKILAGGEFFQAGGMARFNLARFFPDGSLDQEFLAATNNYVGCLALQSDGKILLGGGFSEAGGSPAPYLARLDTDGTPDAFPAGMQAAVRKLAVLPDGKILAGGFFPFGLTRLLPDGTRDPIQTAIVTGNVEDLAVLADGRCLVAGNFTLVGGAPRNAIARLRADGSVDAVYNPNANGVVSRLAVQPDGKVIIAGGFTNVGGVAQRNLARLDAEPPVNQLKTEGLSTVRWLRGGADADLRAVSFEVNPSGSADWTMFGTGNRIPGGWELTGVSLPASGKVRARGHAGDSVMETVATLPTGIERWRQQYFGTVANAGEAADDADSDHDGLVNLVEFAFGLSPVQSGGAAVPAFVRAGEFLTADFIAPAGTEEIHYSAEWSHALLPDSWNVITDSGEGNRHVFNVTAREERVFVRFVIRTR